jgi:hypothetical protein
MVDLPRDQVSESHVSENSRRKRINYRDLEDNDPDFEVLLQKEHEEHIRRKQRIAQGDGEVRHRSQQLQDSLFYNEV